MVLAGHFTPSPGARRSLMSALVLAGALVLVASGAPPASAGPAQEEYKLELPDARGDGGSSTPNRARSLLSAPATSGAPDDGTSSSPGAGSRTGAGANGSVEGQPSSDGNDYNDALLAKARQGAGDSGFLSASTSAAGKTPAGLVVVAALLLIALAGLVAVRRSRRAKGTTSP